MTQPAQISGHEFVKRGWTMCTCGAEYDWEGPLLPSEQYAAHVASIAQAAQPRSATHTRGNHADDFQDTEPCYCDRAAQPQEVPAERLGTCHSKYGDNPHFKQDDCIRWLAQPASAAQPQRCETTQTMRYWNPHCQCPTYAGNLGPCAEHEEGGNGRCVYCDHEMNCKPVCITNRSAAAQPPAEELEAQLEKLARELAGQCRESEPTGKWTLSMIPILERFIRTHQAARERALLEKLEGHWPTTMPRATHDADWIEGYGVCSCGEAKADGVRPYREIWNQHMRSLIAEQREGK